jgi:phosphopantothenate synthetase
MLGSPEERHAREDAERAKPEVVEANMKAIRETLGTGSARRRLSKSEREGGVKLSRDERVIAKTQEEYDAEVARLKAEDAARAAKLARLRKIAEAL